MTAIPVSVSRPLTHRVALRLGRALTSWGARPVRDGLAHAERIACIEGSRDAAARTLPQLPR